MDEKTLFLTRVGGSSHGFSALRVGDDLPAGAFQVMGSLPHGTTVMPGNRETARALIRALQEWLEADDRPIFRFSVVKETEDWKNYTCSDTGLRIPAMLLENPDDLITEWVYEGILTWFEEKDLLDCRDTATISPISATGVLLIEERQTGRPLFLIARDRA